MGKVRSDVLSLISEWTAVTVPPPVVIPPVVVPDPTPTPEVPPVVVTKKLRVATLNCFGYGGSTTETRMKAIAKVIESFNAPLVGLSECPPVLRDKIRPYLPGGTDRWKVWTGRDMPYATILFDSTKVKYGKPEDVKVIPFGTVKKHGAVVAEFTLDGLPVVFGAYHLQPNVVASQSAQRDQVRLVMAAAQALKGFAVIVGDGVNDDAWLTGWDDCRVKAKNAPERNVDTYNKGGITDRIHVLKAQDDGMTYTVDAYGLRKTSATDHKGVVAELTVSQKASTL
jgi:hypothetical protein